MESLFCKNSSLVIVGCFRALLVAIAEKQEQQGQNIGPKFERILNRAIAYAPRVRVLCYGVFVFF